MVSKEFVRIADYIISTRIAELSDSSLSQLTLETARDFDGFLKALTSTAEDNAKDAFVVFDNLIDKYNIQNRFFIESQDIKALKIAKRKNYHVMLWVENIYYWKNPTERDTISVINMIRSQIDDLKPDAISCEYRMYPLLCDSFPDQNIHFWDTPKKYTPENVEFTKKLCEEKSVKVVLVDYPTPEF